MPPDVDYYILYPLGVYGIVAYSNRFKIPKDEKKKIARFLKRGLLHKR